MINQIKQDLVKNNIKSEVRINKSKKHFFLNIKNKNIDIFRAFDNLINLKKYLYSTLKIPIGKNNQEEKN